jgi:hypothetical protein
VHNSPREEVENSRYLFTNFDYQFLCRSLRSFLRFFTLTMMSPSPAVFDRGRPSASVPSTSHCPSDPFNPSISNRHHNNQAASAVFILPTTRPSSKLATLPPVLTLCSLSKRFIPPPTTAATNRQHTRSHTSLLYQWLPPSCQTSCFFSVGTLLVFPGNSIVMPTPLLE